MDLRKYIRDIPDFPKKGIVFKDITTIVAAPEAFKYVLDEWEARYRGKIDTVVGIEARGFIFGAPLADRLGVKFVPVRKPGKLPHKTRKKTYDLEYGTDTIEMHIDALSNGERVVIVDDLLATGGTAQAAVSLAEEFGAKIVECAFVIELAFLGARFEKLRDFSVHSLVSYAGE